jgi:hypothetical protein
MPVTDEDVDLWMTLAQASVDLGVPVPVLMSAEDLAAYTSPDWVDQPES